MRTRRIFALVLIVIVSAVAAEGFVKRVRIQRSDMEGTWVGLTTDELQMIRLTLEPQGDGIIGFSYVDEEPCVFRVTAWTFNAGKLSLELGDSIGRCFKDREMHGVAKGNALEITMRGTGWSRNASLRKEEGLVERWRKLRSAMNQGS